MDNRMLPFAMPGVGSEEEEVIALLSYVAEELLVEHFRAVEQVRQRAEQLSNGVLMAALLAFLFFLMQDFETAPIPLLVLPALLTIVLVAVGLLLRTRLVEASRFVPPRVRRAQKLSWQWIAVPLDEARLLLWDTLTDEGLELQLPQDPPPRPDWLLQEVSPLKTLEEEKGLIRQMAEVLATWQLPPDGVRLPQVKGENEAILALLANLPRRSRWQPAPVLPPARPLEQGYRDLKRLTHLHQSYHLVLQQLKGWEDELPPFGEAVNQALQGTLPHMEPPPAPPPAHPSGDVEALVGTLELVRSTAIEALRLPLQDELDQQREELNRRLKELEEDWRREQSMIHYGRDTLINSLQRRIQEMEQHSLPEAEQALRESRAKLREAQERVRARETELGEKKRELLSLGTNTALSPRASDERRQNLNSAIDRLESTVPELRIAIKTWDEVVASHESTLNQKKNEYERTKKEYDEYYEDREQELAKVDQNYQTRQDVLKDQYKPVIEAIEADLAFFDIMTQQFASALMPYRMDLIMDDETKRPYTEVVQQSQRLLNEKQVAVNRWIKELQRLIEQRRDTIHQLVAAIDGAALPTFGLQRLRLMLLPVWYVEMEGGQVTLWPWQPKEAAKPQVRLLAPFVETKGGRRLAMGGETLFLAPLEPLQRRLDALMKEESTRKALQSTIRRLGHAVSFDPKFLRAIALATQMPRAMLNLLLPLSPASFGQDDPPLTPVTPGSTASGALETGTLTPEQSAALSDEFVAEEAGTASDEDAWEEGAKEEVTPAEDEDAWSEEGPVGVSLPPANGQAQSSETATPSDPPREAGGAG